MDKNGPRVVPSQIATFRVGKARLDYELRTRSLTIEFSPSKTPIVQEIAPSITAAYNRSGRLCRVRVLRADLMSPDRRRALLKLARTARKPELARIHPDAVARSIKLNGR